MKRIGVLRNPRSRRNRGGVSEIDRAGGDVLVAAPATVEELAETARDFVAREVSVVVIDGGDGTIRDALSALVPAYGADVMPQIALVPAGKTNVVVADVYRSTRHHDEKVAELVSGLRSHGGQPIGSRPTLQVEAAGRTLHGFLFGASGFARATRLANERVHGKGLTQGVGVGLSIGLSVLNALSGPQRRAWMAGIPLGVQVDDGAMAERHSAFFIATTLERLMMGIWPFWGGGEGPLKMLDIEAPPRRLTAALMPALRGKPAAWMTPENGYRSGRAQRLVLRLDENVIVDGDPFPSGGQVVLQAGPEIRFVEA